MESEHTGPRSAKRLIVRLRHRMDLLSAAVMAAATVATAYSAYQSSLWNGEQTTHKARAQTAVVRVAKLTNLAMQRTTIHVNLFVHWVSAVDAGNQRTADFLAQRFPEPLKTATRSWEATKPFDNTGAPATPFDMPQYVLQERVDADKWEQIAQDASAASERAGAMANRYLLFTIIYASVLFLAGISGKFKWPAIDLTVLALGAMTLIVGIAIMFGLPRV